MLSDDDTFDLEELDSSQSEGLGDIPLTEEGTHIFQSSGDDNQLVEKPQLIDIKCHLKKIEDLKYDITQHILDLVEIGSFQNQREVRVYSRDEIAKKIRLWKSKGKNNTPFRYNIRREYAIIRPRFKGRFIQTKL